MTAGSVLRDTPHIGDESLVRSCYVMFGLLFFLIPLVALLGGLLVWAARVDRKRRRGDNAAHDFNAAARAARRDAQRRSTEWGAGA